MSPGTHAITLIVVHLTLAGIGAATVFAWLWDIAARAIRACRLRRGMAYTWRRAWHRAGETE